MTYVAMPGLVLVACPKCGATVGKPPGSPPRSVNAGGRSPTFRNAAACRTCPEPLGDLGIHATVEPVYFAG
jgi:hypothetical protein